MLDLVKRRINFIKYFSISYLTTILNVVINLLTIKFLSSSDLGRLSIGRSIFQSYEFAHLGVRNGIDRHMPEQESLYLREAMFTVGLLSSLIFSLCFTIFWAFYQSDDILFYACFYLSGIFYTLATIYRVYYRANTNKDNFINISIVVNVVPALVQLIGFYFFNLNGLVIAHLVSYLGGYLICVKHFKINLVKSKRLVFPVFYKLFKSGYLLFISAFFSYLATVGDRFVIADKMGLDMVGIFSAIMFFFSLFTVMSGSYAELIVDQIMKRKSITYCIKHVGLVSLLVAVCVLASVFLLPFVISYFLPKYSHVVSEIRIIIISTIPYAGVSILNFYLHAIDKRMALLSINLISSSLYFLGIFLMMQFLKVDMMSIVILKAGFFCLTFLLTIIACYTYSKNLKI